MRMLRGLAAIAVPALTLCLAGGAAATYPGANGLLTFAQYGGQAKYNTLYGFVKGVDPATRAQRTLYGCGPESLFEIEYCLPSSLRWSPDGRLLAIGHRGYATYTLDVSTGATRVMYASNPVWDPSGEPRFLSEEHLFSEDDIEFNPSGGCMRARELGIRTEAFSNSLEVPRGFGLGESGDADWSGSGQIAFVRRDCEGSFEVGRRVTHRLLVTTSVPGRLVRVSAKQAAAPSWSPDGHRLVFQRATGPMASLAWNPEYSAGSDIFVTRPGRKPRRLTYRSGRDPVWSPDGRWIAFIRQNRVFIMRPDGSALRRVFGVRWAFESEWDPNMQYLDWQPLTSAGTP